MGICMQFVMVGSTSKHALPYPPCLVFVNQMYTAQPRVGLGLYHGLDGLFELACDANGELTERTK
jgi:hypothetical protein